MDNRKKIYFMKKKSEECYKLCTPCYLIDKDQFLSNLFIIRNNFQKEWGKNVLLGYSIKTNHQSILMQLARREGMVAEAVSDDEYDYAIKLGYDKKQIIFNGPQKSSQYLIHALNNNSIVNIDNLEEINIIEQHYNEITQLHPRIGLRVNFDLESICEGETTAGLLGSRFGLNVENGEFETAINKLLDLRMKIKGIHLHYSTKTRSLKVFEKLAEKACDVSRKFNLISDIQYIDIGGGFWGGRVLEGKPLMEEYSKIISEVLKRYFDPKNVMIILEPGAALLATAISYYSKIKNIRKVKDVIYLTSDGSLLHINPFFIQREVDYKVYASGENRILKQIICGATCLEKDRIVCLENERELKTGDYIQINHVGAYTMGFNNCFINCPPYIYLKENKEIVLIRGKNRHLLFDI